MNGIHLFSFEPYLLKRREDDAFEKWRWREKKTITVFITCLYSGRLRWCIRLVIFFSVLFFFLWRLFCWEFGVIKLFFFAQFHEINECFHSIWFDTTVNIDFVCPRNTVDEVYEENQMECVCKKRVKEKWYSFRKVWRKRTHWLCRSE